MDTNATLGVTWLAAALLTLISTAAAKTPEPLTLKLDEVTQGSLLFTTDDPGVFEAAPTQTTDVAMAVTGPVARATVTQTFRNPGTAWQEAVYAFPLPEDAAVDHMRLHVGERIIEGVIREREEARQTYETARAAGKHTALVEQHRPNLFTTSVANIPPGSEVQVEIAYQQAVVWREGRFGLRFPMAVTPRYRPAASGVIRERLALADGWAILPGEIPNTVPLDPLDEPDAEDHNTVALTLELNAGFPLRTIESRSHEIITEAGPGEHITVRLAAGRVPADRDFVIGWAPETGQEPRAAFFAESDASGDYGLLMVMPPYANADAPSTARETIFVIDTSGSMGGASIRQAKAALATAIERLQPGDRFNVVQFNSDTEVLFSGSQDASRASKLEALRYIGDLEAGGGTEMLPALRRAFSLTAQDAGELRQIVFITDGAIANEAALLAFIHRHLGDRRLFTVGIGSAPNGHFMTEAAHFGRGAYTYIASPSAVQREMTALLEKLERPVLTDAALQLPVAADILPDPIPDLYAGEPLVAVMKLEGPPRDAQIRGRLGTTDWSQQLTLHPTGAQAGIGVRWAREKIRHWTRQEAHGADPERTKRAIVELALDHHLVSHHTSLVAVDVTPTRPADAATSAHPVKGRLPAGWEPPGAAPLPVADIQVALAQGATASPLLLLLGLGLTLLAGLTWRFGPHRRRAGP